MALRMCQIQRLGSFEHPDDGIVGPATPSAAQIGPPSNGRAVEPIDSEMRRRTFWSAFLVSSLLNKSALISLREAQLDRMLCDGHDRPSSMRFEPYLVPIRLPRLDADYNAGRWGLSARFEESVPDWARSAAAPALDGEPEADLFGWMLRVVDLWSRVALISPPVVETLIGAYPGARAPSTRWIGRCTRGDPRSPVICTIPRKTSMPIQWLAMQKCLVSFTFYTLVSQEPRYLHMSLTDDISASVLYLHRDYLPFQSAGGTYNVRTRVSMTYALF